MRKWLFVIAALSAVLMVGSPAMQASAQMSPALAAIKGATRNFTPVEKAACFGWGRYCRPGFHRVCGPRGRRCWCAPC